MSTAAELTAPPSLVIEVSLLRAIPVSFAAETLGSRLPDALPAELRQLSLAAGIEPATFGSDVTRACATPQTFKIRTHPSITFANSIPPSRAIGK